MSLVDAAIPDAGDCSDLGRWKLSSALPMPPGASSGAAATDDGGAMKPYVAIGGSEPLSLKGALLFYEGRGRAFVTWHEAKPSPHGGVALGEARDLTTEFIRRLVRALERKFRPRCFRRLCWPGPATCRCGGRARGKADVLSAQ